MQIGIIGFGHFGQFASKHLKEKAEVFVTDTINKSKEANELGVKFANLEEICSKEIVLLCVPVRSLIGVLNQIKNKLKPGTLIIDTCHLKTFSCNAMKEILPSNIEIIGTHPLFGPESGAKEITGLKIALVNVRSNKTNKVKKFCENLGLKVFITTPEEHDKQMAQSQALTHFIGNVAKKMNLTRVELSTKTYDDLMNIIDIIKNDTQELFEDMQKINPQAKQIRKQFIEESKKLDEELN